jgi:ubiquinone biosynthesis O-methyltransferase
MAELELKTHEDLWGYGKRLRFIERMIHESFASRATRDIRILDVGCGNGSQLAIPLLNRGFSLTGIDIDERSISRAKTLASGVLNSQFICARPEDLSSDSSFDVVILSEVLEHLKEPEALLKAAVARIVQGGILIVTVPNGHGEFEWDSWLFNRLKLQNVVNALAKHSHEVLGGTENHECGHVQFFTRRSLQRVFTEYRLTVIREEPGVFISGPIVGHTLARSQRFIDWNARITRRLPLSWASSWYFALRPEESSKALRSS